MGTSDIIENDDEDPVDDGEDYVEVEKPTDIIDEESLRTEIIEVENAEFVIEIETDSPVLIAFLNEAKEFHSYLSLEDDVSSVPAQTLKDDVEIIDLEEISFVDDTANPSYSPIGNEFDIDSDRAALIDTIFGTLVQNSELVEMAYKEDIVLLLISSYYAQGGELIDGNLNQNNEELILNSHKFGIFSIPPEFYDEKLYVQYPGNYGVKNLEDNSQEGFIFFESTCTETNQNIIHPEGEYLITNDENLNISYDMPALEEATQYLYYLQPEIEFKEDEHGYLIVDTVKWDFKDINGNNLSTDEVAQSLRFAFIEFHTWNDAESDSLYGNYEEIYLDSDRIHEEMQTDITETSVEITDIDIYWRDLRDISITYEDTYSRLFAVSFDTKTSEGMNHHVEPGDDIKSLIQNANQNDRIIFSDGTYNYIEVIKKSNIELIADNPHNVELDQIVIHDSEHIDISGFKITETEEINAEIEVQNSENISIRNNISSNHPNRESDEHDFKIGGAGLDITSSNNIDVIENTFENNNFPTIFIKNSDLNEIQSNYINEIDDFSIKIEDNSSVDLIKDNTVENGRTGISVLKNSFVTEIINNNLNNNIGIEIFESEVNLIKSNISEFNMVGIYSENSNSKITHNEISGNFYGIYLEDSNSVITENKLIDNTKEDGAALLLSNIKSSIFENISDNTFDNGDYELITNFEIDDDDLKEETLNKIINDNNFINDVKGIETDYEDWTYAYAIVDESYNSDN